MLRCVLLFAVALVTPLSSAAQEAECAAPLRLEPGNSCTVGSARFQIFEGGAAILSGPSGTTAALGRPLLLASPVEHCRRLAEVWLEDARSSGDTHATNEFIAAGDDFVACRVSDTTWQIMLPVRSTGR